MGAVGVKRIALRAGIARTTFLEEETLQMGHEVRRGGFPERQGDGLGQTRERFLKSRR